MLDGRFVVGRGALDVDSPEHPLDLGRSHPFEVGHGLDDEHALSGLVIPPDRHQHAGVLEVRPDILGIELLGDRTQRQCLLPLPLFAEEGQEHPPGAEMLRIEFDGELQIDHGEVGVGLDLPLGTEHEGLGVERFDHHRQRRACTRLEAENKAAFRVDLADRHARFVENRDRVQIADLEESCQFVDRQRIGELDANRVDDVAVERCLGPFQRPLLEGPRVALGAVFAGEGLTEPELGLHPRPQFVPGRLAWADAVERDRVDGERWLGARVGLRRTIHLGDRNRGRRGGHRHRFWCGFRRGGDGL